jgi:predicted transcriptional regulator
MHVDRLSITMDPDLGGAVREAAARSSTSVSAWLADAAADRLRNELLGAALDEWEAESTPFSDGELEAAARILRTARGARSGVA